MKKPPLDIVEMISNKANHINLPPNYKIIDGTLYYLYKKEYIDKETKEKNVIEEKRIVTTTPPFIDIRYRDIESGEVSYLLHFHDGFRHVKKPVKAEQITQRNELRTLANIGLDVDDETVKNLLKFLTTYRRANQPVQKNIASRLGHINNYFIHPLIDSGVELVVNEAGYKELVDAFKKKGTLKSYADTVFNEVKNSPMAMMFVYASLGSILLLDFNVEPFVIDMASKSSTGKTTALKVAASVWGNKNIINEWNATKNSIERKAGLLNSFPLLLDDTRKANQYALSDVVYQFTGGRGKGRANIKSIEAERTWQNILLSTGETSIVEYGNEKAGISARCITLQDKALNNDVNLRALYNGLENNYGCLGLSFIRQYNDHKTAYKEAFKGHEQLYINKAGNNEVMQRLGRAFALLQTAGEILNDIEGFEHDMFSIVNVAYTSMFDTNKSIDKPKQLLEELLEELDANRNSIAGSGYGEVFNAEVKAIYHNDYLCVLSNTVKKFLGNELRTITKEWADREYLIVGSSERIVKQVKANGSLYRGYALKHDAINNLGLNFRKDRK
ncbi:hypothetical protein AST01_02420 [Staphylococcus equorum]|uniref:DUF927 domain-containing protein n=1 Tax=Staphylococcus equorum TaxID=246432 RepID=UPI00085386DF|nr:DUF927 domain-containing protein [Staphylococcus equorum]OEK71087.1 hypothetical protein AST01_02420 [Staphylococcus equorum]